jgi:hypothetical protein
MLRFKFETAIYKHTHNGFLMFKEDLIEGCPPTGSAVDVEATLLVYRLVDNIPSKEEDFYSHHKLGKTKPVKVDDCKWRSCSLFLNKHKMLEQRKHASLRSKKCAEFNLDIGSGKILINGDHVDWWIYSGYDIPLDKMRAC